jgi:uncharacterized protein (TIGR03435 family)
VFCKALVYFLVALPTFPQTQTFVSITVKPARSTDPRDARFEVRRNGDLIARAFPVGRLLSYAYDLPANPSLRISTLPDWTFSETYDIEAKAPANAIPPSLQDGEVRGRIRQMVRRLLANRFGLVMRVENKTTTVYALTVSTAGPKLQRAAVTERDCLSAAEQDSCHNFVGGLGHPLNAKAVDMDDLVRYIENWTDLPVVNRTALSGLFTVNSEGWIPMRLPPPPPGAEPTASPFADLPTIFTVLDKLGLELKRKEDAVPVYTLERIKRPAGN